MNYSKERTSKAKSSQLYDDVFRLFEQHEKKINCNMNKGLRFIQVGLPKSHQAMITRLYLTQCLMNLVKFIKASRELFLKVQL